MERVCQIQTRPNTAAGVKESLVSSSSISQLQSTGRTSPTPPPAVSHLPTHLAHLNEIPYAPTLYPTKEEFADSMAYITHLAQLYSNTHGVVKVVPPVGWLPSTRVDLDRRDAGMIDVRTQDVHKPDLQIVSKPHSRVSWNWLRKQSQALDHRWQLKKQRNRLNDSHNTSRTTSPCLSSQPTASPSPSPSLGPQSDPCPESQQPKCALPCTTSSDSHPYAIRSCMYEAMQRIVLEYGYLDPNKRREVEESMASNSNAASTGAVPPAQQPSSDSDPNKPVYGSASKAEMLDRESIYATECDYWDWMYSLSSSRTFYATDVECKPEFRVPQTLNCQHSHERCPFCQSTSCPLVHPPSSWDLNNISWLPRGLLKHLDAAAAGVTEPMIYAGIHHSTFAWHNEDHYLYSLSYMHPSADESIDSPVKSSKKIWYGVPGSASAAFESVLQNHVLPSFGASALQILPQKQTSFSPSILVQHGVPVHKVLHTPNTFVITFPQAYHGGYSESAGSNITESVNFCLPDWLLDARSNPTKQWNAGCGVKASEIYRSLSMWIIIPHSKLIVTMASRAIDEFQQHHGQLNCVPIFATRGHKRSRQEANAAEATTEVWTVRIKTRPGANQPLGAVLPLPNEIINDSQSMKEVAQPCRSRFIAPPRPSFLLDLSFLSRIHAELHHLIQDEETVRAELERKVRKLDVRRLNAESRLAEEPAIELGQLNATEPSSPATKSHSSDSDQDADMDADDSLATTSSTNSSPVKARPPSPPRKMRMNINRPTLNNIVCSICHTSCYLSYIDCTCGESGGEVICLRHPNSICRCGSSVLTLRFDMAELHQIRDQLTCIMDYLKKEQRKEKRKVSQGDAKSNSSPQPTSLIPTPHEVIKEPTTAVLPQPPTSISPTVSDMNSTSPEASNIIDMGATDSVMDDTTDATTMMSDDLPPLSAASSVNCSDSLPASSTMTSAEPSRGSSPVSFEKVLDPVVSEANSTSVSPESPRTKRQRVAAPSPTLHSARSLDFNHKLPLIVEESHVNPSMDVTQPNDTTPKVKFEVHVHLKEHPSPSISSIRQVNHSADTDPSRLMTNPHDPIQPKFSPPQEPTEIFPQVKLQPTAPPITNRPCQTVVSNDSMHSSAHNPIQQPRQQQQQQPRSQPQSQPRSQPTFAVPAPPTVRTIAASPSQMVVPPSQPQMTTFVPMNPVMNSSFSPKDEMIWKIENQMRALQGKQQNALMRVRQQCQTNPAALQWMNTFVALQNQLIHLIVHPPINAPATTNLQTNYSTQQPNTHTNSTRQVQSMQLQPQQQQPYAPLQSQFYQQRPSSTHPPPPPPHPSTTLQYSPPLHLLSASTQQPSMSSSSMMQFQSPSTIHPNKMMMNQRKMSQSFLRQ